MLSQRRGRCCRVKCVDALGSVASTKDQVGIMERQNFPLNHLVQRIIVETEPLVTGLLAPSAYPHLVTSSIELHETHISRIYLAGDYAYKVKKPVKNDFLDYSTLEKRRLACDEELRLGARYATDLYLAVVSITQDNGRICIDGEGEAIEYAVKMHRFPGDALLSHQLNEGKIGRSDLESIAVSIAAFHKNAAVSTKRDEQTFREPLRQALLNFQLLHGSELGELQPQVQQLEQWTQSVFDDSVVQFRHRLEDGFVRECHGDLHCDNVVKWQGNWIPFDGIEFNEALSWIDVLDDACFLMVDLEARGNAPLARTFMNAYLECTGDYSDLKLLRWYAVYRALVRAKVAMIRCSQLVDEPQSFQEQLTIAKHRIGLAHQYISHETPTLWITHGLSGSGKTTGSAAIVSLGAIRIRSDVERKRLFGMAATERSADRVDRGIYTAEATQQTYDRLIALAQGILRSGYSVVVDATFLRHSDRTRFHQLASAEGVAFRILDFEADAQTLRERIMARQQASSDASDADLAVFEAQLTSQESLTDQEQGFVVRDHKPEVV